MANTPSTTQSDRDLDELHTDVPQDHYVAYQLILRIGHGIEANVHSWAEEIALVVTSQLGVDGANITYGHGLWKGDVEHSAAIEIVTRNPIDGYNMTLIRNHIVDLGLTAFTTVQVLEAHELY